MQYLILNSNGQHWGLYMLERRLLGQLSKLEYEWWDQKISIILNLFKLITTLLLYKSFLIRKPTLKNLVVRGDDVCNLLSNGSEIDGEC